MTSIRSSYMVNPDDRRSVSVQQAAPTEQEEVTSDEPAGGFVLNIENLNGPDGSASIANTEDVDMDFTGLEYVADVSNPIVAGFSEGIAPQTIDNPESVGSRFIYDPDTKIGTDMVTEETFRVEPSVAQVLTVSPDLVDRIAEIYETLAVRTARSASNDVANAGMVAESIGEANREKWSILETTGRPSSSRSYSHSAASIRSKMERNSSLSSRGRTVAQEGLFDEVQQPSLVDQVVDYGFQAPSKLVEVANKTIINPITKNANKLEKFVRSIPSPIYWIVTAVAGICLFFWLRNRIFVQFSWGKRVGDSNCKGTNNGVIQFGSAKPLADKPKFVLEFGGGVAQVYPTDAAKAAEASLPAGLRGAAGPLETRAQSFM